MVELSERYYKMKYYKTTKTRGGGHHLDCKTFTTATRIRFIRILEFKGGNWMEYFGYNYNSVGEEIMESYILNKGEIDISHLSNGIYFIRLENEISAKFIKQ